MDHSTFRSEHPSTRIEQAPEAPEAAIAPEGDQGDQGNVDDYEQLRLRLWTSVPVDGPTRPDKALYRELFDLAGLTGTSRLVGWEIASWTNRRGQCHLSLDRLAGTLKVTTRTIRAAISEIRRTGALRTHETGRSLIFELALQGRFHTRRPRRKPADESAQHPLPLALPSVTDPSVPDRKCASYQIGSRFPIASLRAELRARPRSRSRSEPIAVADPLRGRDADRRREQQQHPTTKIQNHDKSKSHDSHDNRRIDGLIAYLAIASRRNGRTPFDEGKTRDDIAAGRTTVLDLQTQADRIRAEDDQIQRKAHDAAQRHHRRATAESTWKPTADPDADPIAVIRWTDHVLAALRRGVLNQRNWSARGRDAGIADPDAEIKTIMRILGPEDDEEAPQDHEQAASATPAPGAHEDPGERATSAPAPRRKNRGVGAERADPAESAQVEPAEPPDPSALRAVFEGLVGGRREWRDRGDR